MKKLFFYLSVAMLAVAAVSCQKEMVMADGENGNVTLTIQTPEVATKAIADGMNVNIVHYEIYKAEEGHKNSLTGKPLIKNTVTMNAKGATLNLNLLQGQTYVGLFWAQVDGKSFYTTTDLRNVTVNYNGSANNENRAAFCQKKVFTTGGNVSVVLERPFAQINLGTTLSSIDPKVNGYPLKLQSSTMEITGVATSFSVADMKTKNETTTVSFEANTVPHNFTPSEVLTVNNVNYAYLGMNYILAANDKATVDVKYTVSTDVGSITRQIPTVPVEKNHRTNLLGNLLTQETAIQIIVDERFAEPDLAPEAIYMAAAMGGEFTLTEDLVLEAPVVVPANSNFVLNLNGKSIKNTTQSEEFGKGEAIIAYGNLTINGEGDVEGSTMAVWARGTDGAKVTINGGTYKGCAEGFAKGGRSVIYASSGNVIDIYGGTFESLSADKSSYANTTEGVYAALNVADNNGMINVYGGTFVKQNPAAPGTEPAAWNAAHPNGFVAEGYKAVENGTGIYTVIPNSGVIASTSAEVNAALQMDNVDFIYLNAGKYTIDMYSNFTFKESLTFIGTKDTKVEFTNLQVRLELCKHFTIKNCEILKMKDKSWGMMVFSTGVSTDGVYTVSNCTFNSVGTQGIFINEKKNGAVYNIENCTFNGDFGSEDGAVTIQNNRGVAFTVNVTGCTFNMTNGSHEISHHYNDSAFTLNTDVDSSKIYCKEN